MKIKARDAVVLWEAIQELERRTFNVQFSQFLVKLKLELSEIVEPLLEARQVPESYLEYERQRVTLAQEHADTDESGKAIVKNGQYVIMNRAGEFQKALQELKDKYEQAFVERADQVKRLDNVLEEEVLLEGAKIDLSNVPDIPPILLEPFMKLKLITD
jgi:hypothetical protein